MSFVYKNEIFRVLRGISHFCCTGTRTANACQDCGSAMHGAIRSVYFKFQFKIFISLVPGCPNGKEVSLGQ